MNKAIKIVRIYLLDFVKLCFGSYPEGIKILKPKKMKEKKNNTYNPWYASQITLWISFTFILLLVIAVLLFILYSDKGMDKKGQLGDSFNGLITPAISMFAAFLVYMSFKEQLRANNIIQKQWLFDTHLRLFNDIKQTFENIELRLTNLGAVINGGREIVRGKEAVSKAVTMDWQHITNVTDVLGSFRIVTMELNILLDKLETIEIENKDYIYHKIYLFYEDCYVELMDKFIELNEESDDIYNGLTHPLGGLDFRIEKLKKILEPYFR